MSEFNREEIEETIESHLELLKERVEDAISMVDTLTELELINAVLESAIDQVENIQCVDIEN